VHLRFELRIPDNLDLFILRKISLGDGRNYRLIKPMLDPSCVHHDGEFRVFRNGKFFCGLA